MTRKIGLSAWVGFEFRSLFRATLKAAVIWVLISASHPALAASGYWKYDSYQITPTQEQLAAVKALPGHVYELKVSGGVQPGPGDGKGSIDLFFKTDNADREVFLATSTQTFGANSQLVTLVPGQKVVFTAGVVVGGNDKSRALPATGSAQIAIDNGDYIAQASAKLGQTASAKGEATIPNGGPGATMVILFKGHLAHLGAMSEDLRMNYVWVASAAPPVSTVPASRFGAVLGHSLNVREVAGGTVYNGTWTRREGTDVFDAVWNGVVRDVIQIESLNGNQIVLYRQGNNGRYYGTLSANGSRITSGSTSWYSAGWNWSATVSGR